MVVADMPRLTEVHVKERNKRVGDACLAFFKPASVFCVSSKHYRANAAGYTLNQDDPFPIGADISGIPALKRYVANLAASRRQQDLLHYVETTIPNLLNSLEMVCSEPTATSFITIPGGLEMHLEVGA